MLRITELLKKYQLSDVKAVNASGNTILHLVVEDKDYTAQETIEILKISLDYGLDLRSKNKQEETVLHLAIKTRARNVIGFLLTQKVVLDNSAALYLIQEEFNKIVELKDQCDDVKQKQESESASFLEWMITRGLDIDRPNLCGRSALFLAIDYNLQYLLPVLLKYAKNIKSVSYESRRTLLHVVLGNRAKTRWSTSYSRRYGTSIVKILLDRGVSPESIDSSLDTALHLAIKNFEDVDVVQMLIDHTKNFDHKNDVGETPFFIAIRQWLKCEKQDSDDYRKICQSLIVKGADVNKENKSRYTPLHVLAEQTSACKNLAGKELKILEMLIHIGCNVNAKDSHNRTPLHMAVAGNEETVVRMLIESGAYVNSKTDKGETPLHLAVCIRAGTKIIELLIEHGANVNAKDCEGFTPLHRAASKQRYFYNNSAKLKLLLEHGADFNALNNEEYAVVHIAVVKFTRDWYKDGLPPPKEWNYWFCFDGYDEVCGELKFLLDHWIKLYAAKPKCIMGRLFEAECVTDYLPETKQIHSDFMKQLEILKNTFIDNGRTTMYDFLHMNPNSRRAHLHNVKLQQLVQSPSQLEKQFPEYAIFILSSYNETIRRKSLMEPAKIAWIKMTKTHLGDLCIEHIFSFLSNAELYDLIEAAGIDYFI